MRVGDEVRRLTIEDPVGGTMMRKPDVELHIEALVLHGVAPGDRAAVGEGVRGELARRLAEDGVPPALLAADGLTRVDAGSFAVPADASAAALGAGAARAVLGQGRVR